MDDEPSIQEYGLQYLAIGSGIREILNKTMEQGPVGAKSPTLQLFNNLYEYIFVAKLVDFYTDFSMSKLEVSDLLALPNIHKTIKYLMKQTTINKTI